MDGTDHFVKGKHKLFPKADHFAAVAHKLLIPYIQRSDILWRECQVSQKPVSLHQNFVVGGESRHIDTAELAQLHIEKTSPLRGTILDDRKILRGKEDKTSQSDQFLRPADRQGIDRDPLRAAVFQMYVDPVRLTAADKIHAQMRFLLPEADQVPVSGGTVRPGCPAEIDCLKNVCLSLGVINVKKIGA